MQFDKELAMLRLIEIAAGYALGIGVGLTAPGPPIVSLGAAALVLLCGAAAGRNIMRLAAVLCAIVCGYCRVPQDTAVPAALPLHCQQIALAQVVEESESVAGQEQVPLSLLAASGCFEGAAAPRLSAVSGRVLLHSDEPLAHHLGPGTLVRLRARLRDVRPPQNPGLPRSEPGWLFATIPDRRHVVLVSQGQSGWSSWLSPWRQRLERHFDVHLPLGLAGLSRALTLGQGRAVPSELRRVFRRTGTAHLLAVSGLHLSIVTVLVLGGLGFVLARIELLARRFDTGKFAAAGGIAAAACYAALAGAAVPVTRAFIMISAALGGRLWHRFSSGQSGLALAVLAILVMEPKSLIAPGFQLSFSAAAVLVLALRSPADSSLEENEARLGRIWAVARWAWRLLRASLAATAVTTPLALLHFQELSFVAVPVNLLAVPAAGLLIVPCLLLVCALVPVWPGAAVFLTHVAGAGLALLVEVLEAVSRAPVAVAAPSLAVSICAACTCVAALAFALRPHRRTAVALGATSVAVAVAVVLSSEGFGSQTLVLDALDVGHGDALLVTSPSGEHLLVDAGGSVDPQYDPGERIVAPALRALGASRLHAFVLSHQDQDHAGGASAVLERLRVDQLWHNGAVAASSSGAQGAALILARRHGVPELSAPALCGSHRFGDATVTVLSPCGVERAETTSNDGSLVLLVEHRNSRLLLLGDIGMEIERRLVARGVVPRVDVLKVAHHGSRASTSEELLEAARPRYAVVSEPRSQSRIGLHRETAERLAAHGAIVLRTRDRGALRIALDQKGIAVRPLVP